MIKSTKKTIVAGLMLAIGILLPLITSHSLLPLSGKVFLPMHIPVILCGFFCGTFYGGICGFLLPYLNSIITGMPVMFPNAVIMSFELLTYGVMSSLMFKVFGAEKKLRCIYPSLVIALLSGRVVYGIVGAILIFANPDLGKISAIAATISGIPGIIIQLLLVPQIVRAFLPFVNAESMAVLKIKNGDATCVVVRGNRIVKSVSADGVGILISLYEQGVLAEAYVADTIIGKAAAMVFAEAGIRGCYGRTVSRAAISYLSERNIPVSYSELTDYIKNRTKDGMCPMETAVLNVDSSEEAIYILKEKLKELKVDKTNVDK